ncbi:hypothetical protein KEM56_005544 [Ascosphaera pollenicola]|nr:hypothetical protein KEM56_005544 [Ascosphaera pollenicola]
MSETLNTTLPASGIDDIIQALQVIHDRASTNESRRQASDFLEYQKSGGTEAAKNGFLLAANKSNSPTVRHFGLSLLQHLLRHGSMSLSPQKVEQVRGLVLELTTNLSPEDPVYIRNKVALLWVEVAKRSWALEWWTMDEEMVELWNRSLMHKEFVLIVLETLSEDIIHHEDTASSLRGTDLNRKLVEICTPLAVFENVFTKNEDTTQLRCGTEGWLVRISSLVLECVRNFDASPQARGCLISSLSTMTSILAWAMPKAIEVSEAVANVLAALTTQNDEIILGAVDALHALYGRTGNTISQDLIGVILESYNINFLRQLYQWSVVGPDDAGELKYTISKKISELAAYLCSYLEYGDYKIDGPQLETFFAFLLDILVHPSLVVSIPILHSFSKLLALDWVCDSSVINAIIGPILEICTSRMVRYESLPEDSDHPTVMFLNEDIDTDPEKHAFVPNYRKYCSTVIDVIVQVRPDEAVPHLLSGVDHNLDNIYSGLEPFHRGFHHDHSISSYHVLTCQIASRCHKWTVALLKADSQFSVVEGILKGFKKWVDSIQMNRPDQEKQRAQLEYRLETWGRSLMERTYEDPHIKQRVLRLSVDISAKALSEKPNFALRVLEHIMTSFVPEKSEFPSYSEAVKELNNLATYEVRRLAIRYSDYFTEFYDKLEQMVQEIASMTTTDGKPGIDLSSVLLMIMQRSRTVDPSVRFSRLQGFKETVKKAWLNTEFVNSTASFQDFCELFALHKVFPYLDAVNADKIEDWTTVRLTEDGKNIQAEMSYRFNQLPIRSTKTFLAVTTDKVKPTDPAHEIARGLWADLIPSVVSTCMNLVKNAHAFHNPDIWPAKLRPVVGRVLTDRFWQAGISPGSKEEFYARVSESRDSLEGFSSFTRGKIRAVRECGYSIIYSMSRLGEPFYQHQELGGPLATALFENAPYLSSHQFSVLLNVSRCLIDDCPPQYRSHFLPPMIALLFTQIDKKLTMEWESIERRKAGMEAANLADEMKDESILRQLTYSAVIQVARFLDPNKHDGIIQDETATNSEADSKTSAQSPPAAQIVDGPPPQVDSIRQFVLSSPQILEPVMVFCMHVLRMKDSRCCGIITRVLRSVLVDFRPVPDTPTAATIREFISSEILKACIESVHDPYFVDLQKDLAQLIASIWIEYGPLTETPRSVILSLPQMSEAKVAATETTLLQQTTSSRRQKALILDLLEGLRGVSVSEQGKITTREQRRKQRSALQAQYMTVEMETQENSRPSADDGPDLTGVADMFA